MFWRYLWLDGLVDVVLVVHVRLVVRVAEHGFGVKEGAGLGVRAHRDKAAAEVVHVLAAHLQRST